MSRVVQKSVIVRCSIEHAFRVFTERVDLWWPKGHRVLNKEGSEIVMEPVEGGRFYERSTDGSTYEFGQVLTWSPPLHLACAWFLGTSAQLPTAVTIRFSVEGEHTRIDIEHRELTSLAEDWPKKAARYHEGWTRILAALDDYLSQNDTDESQPTN